VVARRAGISSAQCLGTVPVAREGGRAVPIRLFGSVTESASLTRVLVSFG
jgi:hypothetical protein